MQHEVAALLKRVEQLTSEREALLTENRLLHQKVQLLLKRMFGRKTEEISPDQLELLLGLVAETKEEPAEDAETGPEPRSPRCTPRDRRARLPEDLPVEEVVVDPVEVQAQPEAFRLIGQEVTEELDVEPARYFRRRIIRRKYVSKEDRNRAPLIAPSAPRLIEGSYASAGLLADIVIKKHVDHLPLYRQEQILRNRHGIELSRKTMSGWIGEVGRWFRPVYELMRAGLRWRGYLQVDETPVRYVRAEGGGSRQGYFWVYHDPGGPDVFYEWHTGRGADCLRGMLDEFKGKVQCDGYAAYKSYADAHGGIELVGCWAHARRYFHDALQEAPRLAGWFLAQIGALYRIESQLREEKAGPKLRQAVRAAQSAMILARLEKAVAQLLPRHLPRSLMGQALSYALGQWPQLLRYRDDGRVEIDNNRVENAIRPTAVGKKNWLFIGHPEAGEPSAILYTILESCKRRGIPQREYLIDVLTRLPAMKITEVAELTPANWQAARRSAAA
jgi:transposase